MGTVVLNLTYCRAMLPLEDLREVTSWWKDSTEDSREDSSCLGSVGYSGPTKEEQLACV